MFGSKTIAALNAVIEGLERKVQGCKDDWQWECDQKQRALNKAADLTRRLDALQPLKVWVVRTADGKEQAVAAHYSINSRVVTGVAATVAFSKYTKSGETVDVAEFKDVTAIILQETT